MQRESPFPVVVQQNRSEKQFPSCSQETSLIAHSPSGRGHRHCIYWNYFKDLAPDRDNWAFLRQSGMASEAIPHMGTLLGLVTILCPPPQRQLWPLCCPPFTQTQISAAKSHLPSLPRTGIGVTRGNQMNSEYKTRGEEEQQRNGRCFLAVPCTECISRHTSPAACGQTAARFLWQLLWEQKLLFVKGSQRLGVSLT